MEIFASPKLQRLRLQDLTSGGECECLPAGECDIFKRLQ